MKKISFLPLLCISVLMTSCLILGSGCFDRGCTDPNAVNYDPNAEHDDGSCEYSSETKYATVTIFRYGDCFEGNTELYMDSEYQKTFTTSYTTDYPDCGLNSSDAVSFSLLLGTYHFTAYADSGAMWDFYVNMNSENACYNVALKCGGYAEGDGVSGRSGTGNLVVWSSFDFGNNIRVKINGSYRGSLRYFYNGDPGCGASGCLTIANVEPGTYTVSAENGTYTWTNFSVLVREGMCNSFELK
jgi:hypothetical protein